MCLWIFRFLLPDSKQLALDLGEGMSSRYRKLNQRMSALVRNGHAPRPTVHIRENNPFLAHTLRLPSHARLASSAPPPPRPLSNRATRPRRRSTTTA